MIGEFHEVIAATTTALAIAEATEDYELVRSIRQRRELFKESRSYREGHRGE